MCLPLFVVVSCLHHKHALTVKNFNVAELGATFPPAEFDFRDLVRVNPSSDHRLMVSVEGGLHASMLKREVEKGKVFIVFNNFQWIVKLGERGPYVLWLKNVLVRV